MVKINKTKAKLKAGGIAFGAAISPHEANLVELAGLIGFDYVVIDWEHFLFDGQMVENCIRAADLHEVTALVRVHNDFRTYPACAQCRRARRGRSANEYR